MNAEIIKNVRGMKWFPFHVRSGKLGPEPSRLDQGGRRDVIGMAILPIRSQDDPGPRQAKHRRQFPPCFERMFQRSVRQPQVLTPIELQYRRCGSCFAGTNRWRAMRRWLTIRQIEHSDPQPLLSTGDQCSPNTDLGVIRMRGDSKDVQWLFQRRHANSSRHNKKFLR